MLYFGISRIDCSTCCFLQTLCYVEIFVVFVYSLVVKYVLKFSSRCSFRNNYCLSLNYVFCFLDDLWSGSVLNYLKYTKVYLCSSAFINIGSLRTERSE